MRLRNIAAVALLALTLAGCGPAGCTSGGPLGNLAHPTKSVGEGTTIDESALSMVKAGATLANNSYALAGEMRLISRELNGRLYPMLVELDAVVIAADKAKRLADAKSYIAKIARAQELMDAIAAIMPRPQPKATP